MRILQTFQCLFQLEMLVFYASLVFPQPLDSPDLLIARQAGAHGVVREEHHHEDANDDCDEAHQ